MPYSEQVQALSAFSERKLSNSGCCIGQKSNVPGPFNSHCKHSLMFCTVPGDPPGYNFTPLSCKIPEHLNILIIYNYFTVCAEPADFSSMVSHSPTAASAGAGVPAAAISLIRHFPPRYLCFLLLFHLPRPLQPLPELLFLLQRLLLPGSSSPGLLSPCGAILQDLPCRQA